MRKKNEKIFWDMEIIGNRQKRFFSFCKCGKKLIKSYNPNLFIIINIIIIENCENIIFPIFLFDFNSEKRLFSASFEAYKV